jgi:hypothetical protein
MGAEKAHDQRHHCEDPEGRDQGLPFDYIIALGGAQLRSLLARVLRRYRWASPSWAEDGAQEVLTEMIASKAILVNGPPMSAPRDEAWAEAASNALLTLAVAKGMPKKMVSKAVYGSNSRWRMASQRGSTEIAFTGEFEKDPVDAAQQEARAAREKAWPVEQWRKVAAAFEAKCLSKAAPEAERRRQLLEVLRRLAQEDGPGPLAGGRREAGLRERPFRVGGITVQLNQKVLLEALRTSYPDHGWTADEVQRFSEQLKRFFERYRSDEAVEDHLGVKGREN